MEYNQVEGAPAIRDRILYEKFFTVFNVSLYKAVNTVTKEQLIIQVSESGNKLTNLRDNEVVHFNY